MDWTLRGQWFGPRHRQWICAPHILSDLQWNPLAPIYNGCGVFCPDLEAKAWSWNLPSTNYFKNAQTDPQVIFVQCLIQRKKIFPSLAIFLCSYTSLPNSYTMTLYPQMQWKVKVKSNPYTDLNMPWGPWEVEVPTIPRKSSYGGGETLRNGHTCLPTDIPGSYFRYKPSQPHGDSATGIEPDLPAYSAVP